MSSSKQKKQKKTKLKKAIHSLSKVAGLPQLHQRTNDGATLFQLTQLKQMEESVSKYQTDHSFIQSVDNKGFATWLQAHNVTNPSVEIRASSIHGAGNGVFVVDKKTVPKLTTVITVPTSLMISSLMAMNESSLRPLFAASKILQQQPSLQLALLLLRELFKGQSSVFQPYILTFPSTFSLPLWWSIAELQKLQGTSALRAVARNVTSFSRFYTHIYDLLKTQYPVAAQLPFPLSFFTLNNFKWAMSVVMTRQNPVPYKNLQGQVAGRCLALVPVMDMVNHGGQLEHGVFYDDETETVNVACMCDTNTGEEVKMYYGDRTNQEFLVHSGFLAHGNQNDAVTIVVQISSSQDPLHKVRLMVLKNEGIVGVACESSASKTTTASETKRENNCSGVQDESPCGNNPTCPICCVRGEGVFINYEFDIQTKNYRENDAKKPPLTSSFDTFCQIMLLNKDGIRAMLTQKRKPAATSNVTTLTSLPLEGCVASITSATRATKLNLIKRQYIACALLRRKRYTTMEVEKYGTEKELHPPTLAETRRGQEMQLLEHVLECLEV
jgi:hypothetical protein